jgi:hypothetical protein
MKARDTLVVLVIAVAAGVGAFLMSFEGTPAAADGNPTAGSLIAIPVAVNSAQEAVCLIDSSKGIMAVYEIDTRFRIKLKSAREVIWDLKIRELQTDPDPDQVKDQIELIEQRRKKAEELKAKRAKKPGT